MGKSNLLIRGFVFLLFGIISFGSRAYAAGGVYQCIPCPAGIDCPEGTNEADIAEDMAAQDTSLGVPVGTIIALAKSKGDEFGGYLLCNGQDIPIGTKYNALRDFLGDTYGAGKVPDFQGHFLRSIGGNAAAVGTEQADSAPNITGWFNAQSPTNGYDVGGAFDIDSRQTRNDSGNGSSHNSFDFDASRSSASYGRRNEVAPANYAVYYYIKY
jgi:microcystin-dependent protein